MQNLTDSSSRSLSSFFLVLFVGILLGLSSCENPGSAGSGLTDTDPEVVIDTLFLSDLSAIQPNSYSGQLDFFSAGQYDDPLFGTLTATSYIKPALVSIDSVSEIESMALQIQLDDDFTYGDSTATQQFDIYEIDERWRDAALKIDDNLQLNTSQQIGTFSLGAEDSIVVDLSQEWSDKYLQFADTANADSLYKYDFYGLALVPNNSTKIVALTRSNIRFLLRESDDTTSVFTSEWGYSLQRGSNSIPQNSLPLYSTYESVLSFPDLGISEFDVSAASLSRVILVLHQNNMAMNQSLQSEPSSVQRPQDSTAYLHMVDPSRIPENIDPGAPLENLTRIPGILVEDGSYRFNVTSLAQNILQNGMPQGQKFYITHPNLGVIRPSLIYQASDQTPDDKLPKIIITSLKNSNNQ